MGKSLHRNPAVENQATDRAFRIGQKQTVNVCRLISADTFEEKIKAMIEANRLRGSRYSLLGARHCAHYAGRAPGSGASVGLDRPMDGRTQKRGYRRRGEPHAQCARGLSCTGFVQ